MSTSLGATPPQSSHRSTAWSSRSCHATLSRPLNLPSVLTTSAARRSWTQWQPVNVHATDRPFGGARKAQLLPSRPGRKWAAFLPNPAVGKAGRLEYACGLSKWPCGGKGVRYTNHTHTSLPFLHPLEHQLERNDAPAHHWRPMHAPCFVTHVDSVGAPRDPLLAVASLQSSGLAVRA